MGGKTSEYVQEITFKVYLVNDSTLIADLFDVVIFEKSWSLCSDF
jgi:hypothetical protein